MATKKTDQAPPDETSADETKEIVEETAEEVESQKEQPQEESVEDLKKELESLKEKDSKRDKTIESLQHDRDYFEDRLKRREQPEKADIFQTDEVQTEPLKEIVPKWDYEKPAESAVDIVDARMAKWEENRTIATRKEQATEAQSAYTEGQRLATRNSPDMFDGIEKEVNALVYASYMKGIIHPRDLRNPETWDTAAQLVHLQNKNFDKLKSAITPVKATSTEEPARAKSDTTVTPSVELDYNDDEVREWMRLHDLTRELAEEIIRDEQKRVESGDPTDLSWKRR